MTPAHAGPRARAVLGELWHERLGGFAVSEDHAPHLLAALEWLCRAQDVTGTPGIARGYSLVRHPQFGIRGWQAAYPETTGYIIPTLFLAARHLGWSGLAVRAIQAAHWEIEVQLPNGAVQGGVIGEPPTPAIFNTGQVILGWLAAYHETKGDEFAAAARRAAEYLVSVLDDDGAWRRGNSMFADRRATNYNARTAWALAEAGAVLAEPRYTEAARRALLQVAKQQHENGWFPACCLTDPAEPLLHTVAYAIRGLLEGGRVLGEASLIAAASVAAERIAERVDARGTLPGRFTAAWGPAAKWRCLTGEAQMANIWMRLEAITGEPGWSKPVPRVLQALKATQSRGASDPGIRGGIKGSSPMTGWYGRFEVLNWATKFFADALMRDEQREACARARCGVLA
ncbi:MAG TPA: hypothetical protein VH113_03655 [Gemmatimonadales bacterium]|jgi:hypothetical protein|nr:hypothetical protein [Gemmatimonadales bacterium]